MFLKQVKEILIKRYNCLITFLSCKHENFRVIPVIHSCVFDMDSIRIN